MTAIAERKNPVERFKELLDVAKTNFSSERYEKVEKMYEFFQERIVIAPASAVLTFHNAYAGGYLDHVLDVIQASFKVAALFAKVHGAISFTKEELVFATMHHDLGKLGDLNHSYYIPNPSEWHIEHRGEVYAHNPDIQYMKVTDRALFLLQHFGITMTQNEWLGIKLSDGTYEDANKPYLVFNNTAYKFPMKSNLHYVVHWSDHIVAVGEADVYRLSQGKTE